MVLSAVTACFCGSFAGVIAALILGNLVSMKPTHLRCNYLPKPLAVVCQQPRLSWWVEDSRFNARQSAFEITIRAGKAVAWKSGKVKSAANFHVVPNLKPETHYEWRIRLWDETGSEGGWSNWEPFSTELSSWNAQWITRDRTIAPAVKPHNGFHSQLTKNADDQKWVEIDLGSTRDFDTVVLFPATPFDWQPLTPGFMFPMRFRIEVDGKTVHEVNQDLGAPSAPMAIPLGVRKGQVVRVHCTKLRERRGDYGIAFAEIQVVTGSEVISTGLPARASDSLENREWSAKNLTNGDMKSHPMQGMDSLPATYLDKKFSLNRSVTKATFYGSALGVFQASINGRKIGSNVLAPEWTDYFTRVQYQAHDVITLIKSGENTISATLGDGWYAGRLGMAQALDPRGFPRAVYGRQALFSAELRVEFSDGTKTIIRTDPTWSASGGPIVTSDLLDGEVFDARKLVSEREKAKAFDPPKALKIVPQANEPIQVSRELKPISLKELEPGKWIADFGQNMVGHVRLGITGPSGTTVNLRHGEFLSEDGTLYTTNLRGAPQVDRITLDGKPLNYEPTFTYHGFRYVEVSAPGCSKPSLLGRVFHSTSPETMTFDCSDPMVNRLWQNIVWTQRANLMSVPTDCPQRDERLGWTGDLLSFGATAFKVMDLSAFGVKWLTDLRDSQADDGRFPDFAPHPYGKNDRFTGVPGWGDAAVGVAWDYWKHTADKRVIREHFPAIEHYLGWIEKNNPNYLWINNRGNDYGDWLNGDTVVREGWPRTGGECPKEVFATMMWFQSADAAIELSRAAGLDSSRWEKMAASISAAFAKEFIKDGKIKGDTQAGYGLALSLGILAKADQASAYENLIAAVKRTNNHITTGFHSTHRTMEVLSSANDEGAKLAYTLLLNKSFPSWGYTIEQGATTIWERWDGFVKGRGFQDPGMNSFNHWALGSVGQWMIENIVGIRPLNPGWSEFVLAPVLDDRLSHGGGTFDSPVGRIVSKWKRANGQTEWEVLIPANSVAHATFPGDGATDGKKTYKKEAKLGSGSYRFVITHPRR